jgi:hypothetical protein
MPTFSVCARHCLLNKVSLKLLDLENMVCDVKLQVFRVFCVGEAHSLCIVGSIRHLAYFILMFKDVSV